MKQKISSVLKGSESLFFTIILITLSLAPFKAYSAAYTVNGLGDAGAGAGLTGDLRYCITQANAIAGPHTITFSVAGTINLTATLPVFVQQISVFGNTAAGNAPLIELNGTAAAWAFLFNSPAGANSVLRGLAINRAQLTNVEVNGVNGITIQDCYIGTTLTGAASAGVNPNFGIQLVSSSNNFIINNIISGHAVHGLLLNVNSNNNTVRGNKIGCNLLGTAAIPNLVHGIELNNTSINNIIGGAAVADRNIISGNGNSGLSVVGSSSGIQITNNYIGVNLAGTAALSNAEHGVIVNNSASATITNNVISGNLVFGIHILDANGHTVRGNKVGMNAAGTAAIGNTFVGIRFENSDNAIIGGSAAGQSNTSSGNGEEGILMINCDNANIKGNYIGVNSTGAAVIANGRSGIRFQNCDAPVIGGTLAGEGNTLSGNVWDGIQFEATTNAIIQGNFIGTNMGGTLALGNQGNGISGYLTSSNHLIGGTAVAARNILSGNNIDGIHYDGNGNDLVIQNNYIGTNASGAGNASFGNGKSGVVLLNNCLRPVIGGTVASEKNIISNNGRLWGGVGNGTGIVLNGGCHNASITGNYIGLAVDGTTALGNLENGIVIVYSNNATIGGNSAVLRNLVSSNGRQGIVLSADPGTVITGTSIIGNYCGTDVTGTLARGNGQSGIISIFASNGFIGRANANEGNILSNNGEHGLHLVGGTANIVYNNKIGVALNGTTAMGNLNGGVYIQGVGGGTHGSDNIVGGLAALQPNIIAYSTGTGAVANLGNGFGIGVAHDDQGLRNTFIANKIFCNAGLGIDLNFSGTFGGAGTNGVGNGGKTAPAITAVTTTSTSGTGINGETIHVYSNVTCTDCQGETYLGSAVVAGGVWTVPHVAVADPAKNSATATNGTQGTSQFSCNTLLPVGLLNFYAKAAGNVAQLDWNTSWETNNQKFVLERSADGIQFTAIAEVAGSGTVSTFTAYSYTDETPLSGISYYRLTQVDFDSQYEISPIRAVSFGTPQLTIYPNPVTDHIRISIRGIECPNAEILIYNSLGAEILTVEVAGPDNVIDLSAWASGLYYIHVKCDLLMITEKIYKH